MISSEIPYWRKISMVRWEMMWAFGRVDVEGWRSKRMCSIECAERKIERERPHAGREGDVSRLRWQGKGEGGEMGRQTAAADDEDWD
jgi:hypothetical protein